MFSFMKSFATVKGQQLGQDIVKAIVELDPEGASKAQIDQMARDLDAAGGTIQRLRADLDRETREADEITARYEQMLAAAEVLQRKLDAPDVADRAGIEASLAKLVGQLEALEPDVAAEKRDVDQVKALMSEAEAAYRAKAEALVGARQSLERAKRDMQRAVQEQERAVEKAQRAAEVAGLREGGVSGLTVATDAMNRRADEARARAGAAKLKAETLASLSRPDAGDPHIEAALKEAQGGGAGGSIADRLARLKR